MREAVVAIFTYKDEMFSIRRQNYLRAFPGYYAFPGGKVDEGDAQFAPQHALTKGFAAHEIGALCRELEEELGYSLADDLARDNVADISKLGIAVTPAFEKVRFNAHYFKIALKHKPAMQVGEEEISWSGWQPAKTLLERYDSGKTLMVVPTFKTVQALAQDSTVREIPDINLIYDEATELPYLELLKSVPFIPVPSNTLPPAINTNSLLLGDAGSKRFITDPSAKSDEVYQKLINTLKKHPIDAIMITHHHPDHHERAPKLARELGVPIYCSAKTQQRIAERASPDYFADITLHTIAEGDVLTQSMGQDVICHELPGHDDGMIGLASADMFWFYVSDLVLPFASVVIPEPEGNMQLYFDSLERVIALNPKVVIPSHGMPMGGTEIVKTTLKHRIKRENKIKELLDLGMQQADIVSTLYKGIDEKLMPLAEQNVRQHLRKLGALEESCSDTK